MGTAATTRSFTVREPLVNGQSYIFQMQVHNAGGWSAVARSDTVTLPVPCLLAGPTAPTMAENTAVTTAVGTYTVSGDCGSESAWRLSGTDASWFELKALPASSSSQKLHFKNSPNFEQPDDDDDQNTYEVTVSGGDGTASVSVTVTDVNDAGHIGLSTTTPRAGQAITATLSDADGVEEPVYWTSNYSSASDEAVVSGQASEEATLTWMLTIPRDRVGKQLRIQANYTDSFGAGSATSALTSPIGEDNRPPCSPTAFAAVAGDEQVSLSWQAPTGTNCGVLTCYAYRYKGTGGSWSDTTDVKTATSHTVKDLTNGILYTFELHAANDYGTSPAVSATATPQPPPMGTKGSVSLSPDPPQAGSTLTATLSDPDTPITGLRWRYVQLPASGPVRLTLYNVAGQVVHTLVDTALEAGYHTFYWDGRRPTRTPRNVGRVPVSAECRQAHPRRQNGPDPMISNRGARL